MQSTKQQAKTTDLEQRKAFCSEHGHNYTTWLPGYRSVEHKHCTYCGTPKAGEK